MIKQVPINDTTGHGNSVVDVSLEMSFSINVDSSNIAIEGFYIICHYNKFIIV